MVDFECKPRYDIQDLLRIMELLRSPDGCPWDRAQTHQSIRRNMLEEAYEAAEAIDENDPVHLKEELGDVLLQVVFHARMAQEAGWFDFDGVVNGVAKDGATIGEGAKSFTTEVVDKDGGKVTFTVKTDADTVGKALLDQGVIAGEDSSYGLYVKTVNGTTLDYDTDGMYWAFYINGEYAQTGVDATGVEDGAVYAFRAEK